MLRPRIALLSSLDTASRKAFSGTSYYMSQALEKHCGTVTHLGPVRSRVDRGGALINRFSRSMLRRRFVYDHSPVLAWEYGRIFAQRLHDEGPFDVIFAPAASTQIAMLKTDIPIIYASDATFKLNQDYHQDYSDLRDGYAAMANDTEGRAIRKAAALTYPSHWAANSAINDYGASRDLVSVIPWGANVDQVPDQDSIPAAKDSRRCSLLFIGVNWERKGGPIAYGAADILRRRGVEATLTVCGCTPPEGFKADWFRVIPFLNKQVPAERDELSQLLLRANFFVLPTRNDCFPMVLAEASAHGTPSVVTDTGGVSDSISEGRSGFLLPVAAGPEAYADVIQSIWSDPDRYRRIVLTSRQHYDGVVNWDRWGLAMREVIARLRR